MNIEIKLTLDGDYFCALVGDDLKVGNCGFGKSPIEALHALVDDMAKNFNFTV